jgi:mannosylglycerate hydrolase
MDWMKEKRADSAKTIEIISNFTVRKDNPVIEIETAVENTVRDHFLRVCFPTGIEAKVAHAETPFDVVKRPVASSRDGDLKGPELLRHPHRNFVDLSDEHGGLALFNKSVSDYQVFPEDKNTIALSLFRSHRLRIPVDNRLWKEYPGEESSQALRKMKFNYALFSHSGDHEQTNVSQKALEYLASPRLAQIGRHKGSLPLAQSFLKIEPPDLVLSAFKKAEDDDYSVLRLHNPVSKPIEGTLSFFKELLSVQRLTMNEEIIEEIVQSDKHSVSIKVEAKRVLTLGLKFAKV